MPTSTWQQRHDTPSPAPDRKLLARARLMSITSALLIATLTLTATQRTLPTLVLDPGAIARTETVVNFPLPPRINGESLQLLSLIHI